MGDLDEVRARTRSWIRAHWDPDATMGHWWRLLAEAGYSMPQWPTQWQGLGYSTREAVAVRQTLAAEGVPGPPAGLGMMMAAPTIFAHGTDAQKRRYLPSILSGEANWCQLFSEPDAGSDLASVKTSARKVGDRWIVRGQKVWTSNGHLADTAMLIARTNPDSPKHQGITWFAFSMDQPNVEVRPLKEMTGRSLFTEVFLNDAIAEGDAIIDDVNGGWPITATTLAHERASMASGIGQVGGIPGQRAGVLEHRVGDVAARLAAPRRTSGTAIAMKGKTYQLLSELARERGRAGDPCVRQLLAELYSLEELFRVTQIRGQHARRRGLPPGPESSTGKLALSSMTRLARDLALELVGADGMLVGSDAPRNGLYQEMALFSPAVSIYGGTDEIQRNIISERILGLPRESSP